MTQVELGNLIGVNKETINMWERGIRGPLKKNLEKVLGVLDLI